MIKCLFSICIVMLFSFPGTGLTTEQILVGDFSRQGQNTLFPLHWEPLVFDNINKHTIYTRVLSKGTWVIQAKSKESSSSLIRKITIAPDIYSIISFRWKIQDIIESADLSDKNGNDAPARVFITFTYDPAQVGWLERMKFEACKLFYGEYPPIATLIYVWASHLEKGTIIDSPYTNRAKIIVLESGADKKGKWLNEKRNVYADFRRAFASENVPMISGVAIMTDTDNTNEQVVSWYGDIVFSAFCSK